MAITNKTLPKSHQNIIASLTRGDKIQNLHHALLFYGPVGCGQDWVVDAFLKKISAKPKIDPDIVTLNGNEQTGIEYIRSFIEAFHVTPLIASRKIGVIKNIQKFTLQGKNALLKTLEEPPENSLILMTAHNLEEVPETISSRSAKIYLGQLSHKDFKNYLSQENLIIPDKFKSYVLGKIEYTHLIDGEQFRESIEEYLKEINSLLNAKKTIFDITTSWDKKTIIETFENRRDVWITVLRESLKQSYNKQTSSLLRGLAKLSASQSSNLQLQIENLWIQ